MNEIKVKTYAGYFYNWDEIPSIEGVNMLYILVDGTFGLCLFEYYGWITEFKQQISFKDADGLWEVVNLQLTSDPIQNTTLKRIDHFYKAAMFFPKEDQQNWENAVYVYADIVDEIILRRWNA